MFFNSGDCAMNKVMTSLVAGCSLMLSGAVFAAGNTHDMTTMDGGTGQTADAKAEMSHGEIKKIDAAAGKLTIKHGPLVNLGMDAMTMTFKVKSAAMISQVKVGDKVDFVAEDLDGGLTVTMLHKD
jgi:Cu/Ag efflux protein CusF